MKRFPFPISLFIFSLIIITFSNCRNKQELIDPLNILGKWNVIEFKIDSENQLGTAYNNISINFGEISDGVGPFAIITEDINGSSNSQGGEYSLDIDFTKIYLTITGTTIEYAINFDMDNLMMQGFDENNRMLEYNCDKEE